MTVPRLFSCREPFNGFPYLLSEWLYFSLGLIPLGYQDLNMAEYVLILSAA